MNCHVICKMCTIAQTGCPYIASSFHSAILHSTYHMFRVWGSCFLEPNRYVRWRIMEAQYRIVLSKSHKLSPRLQWFQVRCFQWLASKTVFSFWFARVPVWRRLYFSGCFTCLWFAMNDLFPVLLKIIRWRHRVSEYTWHLPMINRQPLPRKMKISALLLRW